MELISVEYTVALIPVFFHICPEGDSLVGMCLPAYGNDFIVTDNGIYGNYEMSCKLIIQ